MLRTKTRYSLLVIDDGERVIEESYDSDAERAAALDEAITSNHDEIEEAAPRDVVESGSQAVREWYESDLSMLGIDVYLDEELALTPAPQDLYHVVSLFEDDDSDREEVFVATYVSDEERRKGLIERVRQGGFDEDRQISDEATAQEAIEALQHGLPVTITLIDATGQPDVLEWYG